MRLARAGSGMGRGRMAGAIASFAAVPAVALAAALTTCVCPAHQSGVGHATAVSVTAAGEHQMAGHAGSMASAHDGRSTGSMGMTWVVGSERAPLVTRNLPGPLLRGEEPAPTPPAASNPAASATHVPAGARQAATAARAEAPLAQRATLTVSEATAKLSPRCRKLIKAKRPSRLSKADRRKRTACLKQRSKLIAESAAEPTPTTPAATPAPTPVPGGGAPPATTPGSVTPTPAPTAAPSPASPCAGKNPCVAAIGVSAIDSGSRLYFTLTRATVMGDRVSFEYTNTDSQSHNLYIERKGDPASQQAIVADLAMKDRATVELALAPGTYTLRCTIPGHGGMVVDFVVQAPIR